MELQVSTRAVSPWAVADCSATTVTGDAPEVTSLWLAPDEDDTDRFY